MDALRGLAGRRRRGAPRHRASAARRRPAATRRRRGQPPDRTRPRRDRIRTEPAALLDDVRAVVAEALDELRGLAQRIHPSLLDTQGLIAALRTAAANRADPDSGRRNRRGSRCPSTRRRRSTAAASRRSRPPRARRPVRRSPSRAHDGVGRIRDHARPERASMESTLGRLTARVGTGRVSRGHSGPRRRAPAPHLMSHPRRDTG